MSRRALILIALLITMLFGAGLALAQDATDEAPAIEATAVDSAAEPVAAASGGMVTGLRHLHSLLRWVVVVLAVLVLLRLLLGLMQGSAYDGLTRRLMLFFTIGLSLQWLVGLVLFVLMGGFDVRYRLEHAVVMTIAVALASMSNRWKNAADNVRYRNSLIIVLIVLALVYVGVARLPQGWMMMPAV